MAIQYFLLDIKLARNSLKIILFLPLLFIIFLLENNPMMGLGYQFFFVMIVSSIPFSIEKNERCETFYYMLPAKVSNMVLGRFIYLSSLIITSWLLNIIFMTYLFQVNKIDYLGILSLCMTGTLSAIFSLVQYPFYYKFGLERGRILSTLFYLIPAFIIFALPSFLNKKKYILDKFILKFSTFSIENIFLIAIAIITVLIVAGTLSFLVSTHICKNKEI